MKVLFSEYGKVILSIIGGILFTTMMVFVIQYFDAFSKIFIATLTGSE